MRLARLLAVPSIICLAATGALAEVKDRSGLVPADIRQKGYIEVATDPSFGPPWNYNPVSDQSVYEGINPDIAADISKRLGVEIRFVTIALAGMIPAIRAGRYDMLMQGMYASEERTKIIDFVGYALDSTAILVQAGNPHGIKGPADLCGKTVSVVAGTIHLTLMEQQSARCAQPITIVSFPNKSDSFLQVETKRVDATLEGYIVSGYLSKNGVFASRGIEAVFTDDFPWLPLGIGLAKEKTELRDAVATVINDMIEDGSYAGVFAKWGTESLRLEKAEINPLGEK